MLFLSNIATGARSPYRVERVENDLRDQKDESQQCPNDEAFTPEKLEAAAKKLKEKKINATAMQAMETEFITLDADLTFEHAVSKIDPESIDVYAVVNQENKFLGLVDKKQLEEHAEKQPDLKLASVLNSDVLCSEPKTEIMDIIPVFISQNLKSIPVINKEHQIVGILMEESFMNTILKVMWQSGIIKL
jgi:CBS-domain-containing membrane protein